MKSNIDSKHFRNKYSNKIQLIHYLIGLFIFINNKLPSNIDSKHLRNKYSNKIRLIHLINFIN